MTVFVKRIQAGYCEFRCPHEDYFVRFAHLVFKFFFTFLLYIPLFKELIRFINKMPFKWSISCWRTTASNPSASIRNGFSFLSKPSTRIEAARLTSALKSGTLKHPSSSEIVVPSFDTILGLTRTCKDRSESRGETS